MDVHSQLAIERLLAEAGCDLLAEQGDDLAEVIHTCLGRFGRQIGASRCQYLLMAPDQQRAKSEYEWCVETLVSMGGVTYTQAELPQCFEATAAGRAFVAFDTDPSDAPFSDLGELVRAEGICCCVAVPIGHGGTVAGLVVTDFAQERPRVDDDFLDAHRRFGDIVRLALGRRSAFEQAARDEARLAQKQKLEALGLLAGCRSQRAVERFLAEAARDLLTGQRHDLPDVIDTYLRRFGEQIGASRCQWFAVPPDKSYVTSEYEWCLETMVPLVGATYTAAELPRSFKAMVRGENIIAYDTDPDDARFADLSAILRAEGVCCCVAIPTSQAGAVKGVVVTEFVLAQDAPRRDDEFLFEANERFAATIWKALERRSELEQAALVEARLVQKQKLESLGLLAGGVAHDFNNALQVIQVSSEMLRDEIAETNDEALQSLDLIAQAAESASDLTCRLLMFGRDEVSSIGRTETSPALRRVFDMVQRMIPESVETSMLVDADLPAVPVRRGNFEQAVLNLMTNALHAMPDGGRLTVKANSYREESQEHVSVTVADTGKGMSPDQLDRACEPFFTTKAPGEGTGLGLANVNSMARKAGGQLVLQSAVGEGTRARLILPAAKRDSLRAPAMIVEVPTGTETILVVEDNVLVRRVAQSVLERAGYTVLLAQQGLEALGRLQMGGEGAVDLVVSDAIMPRMGGRALYEACQSRGLNLPFLFCTGYSASTLDAAFLEESGCKVLPKPWKPVELLTRVRRILDQRAALKGQMKRLDGA